MNEDKPIQRSMFDPPIARPNDPDTSHAAAEQHTALGKRAYRQWQVLELVSRYPYKTSGELARIFVREHPDFPILAAAETPHKRISDLMQKGLVERGAKRQCKDSGFECYTYAVTELGMWEAKREREE